MGSMSEANDKINLKGQFRGRKSSGSRYVGFLLYKVCISGS